MNPTASDRAAASNASLAPIPSIVTRPPGAVATAGSYRARLAATAADLQAAQCLRFEVFNVELQEGLKESWSTRRDADRFDERCDHLLVEHIKTREVVGTYRLQTGIMAASGHGYYSAQEFDFAPFESIRTALVELGRACVHQDHRKMNVLNLLWRGITAYARQRNARYMIGCSSLTSQDPALGEAMYRSLAADYLVTEDFRTSPLPGFALPECEPLSDCPKPPRLLRTYLTIGAKICGAPAIDRAFGTIDFLTFIDLRTLPAPASNRYLS